MHKNYYEQWAENWEFQALLKARPVAGDPDLGQAYMDMTRPFVWSASKHGGVVSLTKAQYDAIRAADAKASEAGDAVKDESEETVNA